MLPYYLLALNVIINNLPFIFLTYIFYSKKLRLSITKVIVIALSFLAVNITSVLIVFSYSNLSNDISICFFMGFSILFFFIANNLINDVISSKNFVFLITACYAYIVRFFAQYIARGFFQDTTEETFFIAINLISISILILTMPLFSRIILKYIIKTFETANKRLFKFMWILPAFTLIILIFLELYAPYNMMYDWKYFVLIICLLTILVISYSIFFNLLKSNCSNESLSDGIKRTNQLIDLQTKRYFTLTENIIATIQARHDMRHHINVISAMLDGDKIDEVKEYLKNYANSTPTADSPLVENYAIDCLLRHYFGQTKALGTEIRGKTVLPHIPAITDIDLCVIIGNLLENADDAVKNIAQEQKYIVCNIDYVAQQLVIAVDNPYAGTVMRGTDGFYSMKRKNDELGIGLFSVKTIVEKYNGFMEIKTENNIFSVNIVINCNEIVS